MEKRESSNMGDLVDNHKGDKTTQLSVEACDAAKDVELASEIQQWFAELSVEERASALGFFDRPVLSVILKHASPSSYRSIHAGIPKKRMADKQDNTKSQILDWNSSISTSNFERLLQEDIQNSATPPSGSTPTSGNGAAMMEAKESMSSKKDSEDPSSAPSAPKEEEMAPSVWMADKVELSDAFRIRDGREVPTGVGDGEKPVDTPNLLSRDAPPTSIAVFDIVSDILNNVCVVFPSSLKQQLGTGSETHPFVTIHPSYLRTRDGANVFSRLDDVARNAIPNAPLLSIAHSSWKEFAFRVGSETSTIPLYMLLVVRMRLSLLETFHQCRSDAAEMKVSDGDSPGSTSISCLYPVSEVLSKLGTVPEIDTSEYSHIPDMVEATIASGHCLMFPLISIVKHLRSSNESVDEALVSIDRVAGRSIELLYGGSGPHFAENDRSNTDPSGHNSQPVQDPGKSGTMGHGQGQAGEIVSQTDQTAPQTSNNGKKRKKKKKVCTVSLVMGNKKKGTHNHQQKRKGSGNAQATVPAHQTPIEQQPGEDEPRAALVQQDSLTESSPEEKGGDLQNDIGILSLDEASAMPKEGPLKDDMIVNMMASESASRQSAEGEGILVRDLEKSRVSTENGDEDPPSQTEIRETAEEKKLDHRGKNLEPTESDGQLHDDSGEWETVEVKPRGNRKKAADRANQGRLPSTNSNSHGQNGNGSKKSKANRNHNRKQKANVRKMAREILSNVLDRVDDDVRQRRKATTEAARPAVNQWAMAAPSIQGTSASGNSSSKPLGRRGSEMTMRDILVGRQQTSAPTVAGRTVQGPPRTLAQRIRQPEVRVETKNGVEGKKVRDKLGSSKPTGAAGAVFADQNTAPTIPETLSAVSAETLRNAIPQETGTAPGDCSAEGSGEGLKPPLGQGGKDVPPSPPLPTLLTENANSSSSSVASSLDTSNAGHPGNHISSNQGNEKDVGYHLLDVCDRLTRDINIFMNRREHALEIRRRERGSVLMALQATLSGIWPGVCNVEMYGSCATQLDLPSSDLDVVVRGLDRPSDTVRPLGKNGKPEDASGPMGERMPENSATTAAHPAAMQQHPQNQMASQQPMHPQMMYGHLSLNADRIRCLAMELERQPWAAHVKAIPTATVPVIKVLADPSRTSGNGEWLMQPPMSTESSPINGQSISEQRESNGPSENSMPHFQRQQTPPWRGADVMNGLLKVDITFEGPEHGGIGSTEFSSRVVKEFCDETSLPPDSTPAVQVLMVVKELLAQRRLNEPFSGGLSSYALLLLVISVLRERAIIREELEKVEHQRRIVAAGNVDSGLAAFPSGRETLSGEEVENMLGSTSKVTNDGSVEKKKGNTSVSVVEKRIAKGSSGKPESEQVVRAVSSVKQNWKEEDSSEKPGATMGTVLAGTASWSSSNAKTTTSSWASIAKKSSSAVPPSKPSQESPRSTPAEKGSQQQARTLRKASSFADAVANGNQGGLKQSINSVPTMSRTNVDEAQEKKRYADPAASKKAISNTKSTARSTTSPSGTDSTSHPEVHAPTVASNGSMFPQGFHDVTEVLCSGETTAGKLLMHFLLFYGQHFDSQSTAIDYSGTHRRDASGNNGYSQSSPYMLRRTAGSYDPITGMLTVDPIVVYDPLEGAEANNVARSCFAWSSIRWVFAQSYLTLLSTVEINQNHSSGQVMRGVATRNEGKSCTTNEKKSDLSHPWSGPYGHDKSGNMMIDPSSPLLELLLSF